MRNEASPPDSVGVSRTKRQRGDVPWHGAKRFQKVFPLTEKLRLWLWL